MAIIWELLFSLFDILVLTSFSDLFMKKKRVIIQAVNIIAVTVLIFLFSYFPIFSYFSAILITIATAGYIFLSYNGSLYKKIITCILFQVIYGLYSLITVTIFSIMSSSLTVYLYQYESNIRLGFVILTRGFLYIVLLFLNRKNEETNTEFIFSMHLVYVMLVCVTVVFAITNMTVSNSFRLDGDTSFILIGLVLLFIFSVTMEKKLFDNRIRINQLESSAKALEMQTVFYESQSVQDKEIRRTKHDLKNTLFTLESLIKEQKYEQAQKYISDLTGLPALKKTVLTNNTILDALININIQMNPSIHFVVDIQIGELNIDQTSIAIILGNALNNAVESVNHLSKDKYISLTIIENSQKIVFRIENNYLIEPCLENGNLQTLKEDKENHGLGILSIKKEVKKYNGKVNIDIDKINRKFKLDILLLK